MIERNLIDRNADDLRNELFTYTRHTGNNEAPFEDATKAIDEAPIITEREIIKPVFEEFREKLSRWMFHNCESVRGDNMIDIDYLEGHMDELMWELGIERLPEDSNE